MQKITPCLWFDGQAEEAVDHYLRIFKSGRIITSQQFGEPGRGSKGNVLTILFEIEGQRYLALNGGALFKFTEAISMMVNCEDQAEIDHYWDSLTAGGTPSRCGWLKDKFGLSWQIVPRRLPEIIGGDPARAGRVMQALLGMGKLDIASLEAAAAAA